MQNATGSCRIVLFGLDDVLASELTDVLSCQRHSVLAEPYRSPGDCVGAVEQAGADVVFCCSERDKYMALLEAIGRKNPELPVIVVSRVPEVSEWLDAIEAGASDYCAAPFETSHIRWILESTLKRKPPQAVRGAAS